MNTDAINKDECANSDNIQINNEVDLNKLPVWNYGWICPKCGSVWSPDTTCCTNCLQATVTVSTTNTTLDITDY